MQKFIEGLPYGEIIERDLSLNSKCRAHKVAMRQRAEILGDTAVCTLQKQHPDNKYVTPSKQECPGCGSAFHPGGHRKYPAFHLVCHTCNKVGHLAKVCNTRRPIDQLNAGPAAIPQTVPHATHTHDTSLTPMALQHEPRLPVTRRGYIHPDVCYLVKPTHPSRHVPNSSRCHRHSVNRAGYHHIIKESPSDKSKPLKGSDSISPSPMTPSRSVWKCQEQYLLLTETNIITLCDTPYGMVGTNHSETEEGFSGCALIYRTWTDTWRESTTNQPHLHKRSQTLQPRMQGFSQN